MLADARHFRGPVEDRDEIWVEAWAAAYVAALADEEEVRVEAGAEALWAVGGGFRGGGELRADGS